MPAALQHAIDEQYCEPFLYHDPNRPGYVSLLTQVSGKKSQNTVWLGKLGDALSSVNIANDTWVSQAEFHKPNRRAVNVWRIQLAFSDLDTYNIEQLRDLSPEHLAGNLLIWCADNGIPEPSLVVFSGRGLQVKWLFEKPIPAQALPRWQAVQEQRAHGHA